MDEQIPKQVLEQYRIGHIQSIERISVGLMHATFQIKSDLGSFILQKLHPLLSTQDIGDDFFAVTSFLNQERFPAPACITTVHDEILATNDTERWRMQTALHGTSFDRIDDLKMIEQAGELLGRFHRTISKLSTPLKSSFVLPPDSRSVFKKFATILPDSTERASRECTFLLSRYSDVLLPLDLPTQIIHGDPKISNFLFNGSDCVGLIDLDTCNRQSVLMELGDAFRSWCGGIEDDQANVFSVEKFEAGFKGYRHGAGDLLSQRERALLPQAISLVILELACRFLTDYFEDSYFGWDEQRYESRREHNLARCRGQIAEFVDFESHLKKIESYCV